MISLHHTGVSSTAGTVTFIYQDGRNKLVGNYTGTVSGDGRLTMELDNRQTWSGTFSPRQLDIAACGAFLPFVTTTQQCVFSYAGGL
jgi:hypothetical protein